MADAEKSFTELLNNISEIKFHFFHFILLMMELG